MNVSRRLRLFATIAFSAKPFRQRRTPDANRATVNGPRLGRAHKPIGSTPPATMSHPRCQARACAAMDAGSGRLQSTATGHACSGKRNQTLILDRGNSWKEGQPERRPDDLWRFEEAVRGTTTTRKSAVITPTAGRSAPILAERRPSAPRRWPPVHRYKRPCPGKSPRGCASRRAA
jgi:hypothetical protein